MKTLWLAVSFLMATYCFGQEGNTPSRDQELYQLAKTDLKAFAEEVSSGEGSEIDKANRIIKWLARNFDWTATDYQQRTVQEIIERKGGNCNELAMVANVALKELKFKMRRVREINVHKEDSGRGVRAANIVKEKGKSYSVFGRRHNDHVWLEIFDSKTGEWFPADPSMGVVGREWLSARVGFGNRFTLNPISKDMVTPVAIFAVDEDGKLTINRTRYYLVEGLNELYNKRLSSLPVWEEWVSRLDLLQAKCLGAFRGEIDLHADEHLFDELANTYETMRQQYGSK